MDTQNTHMEEKLLEGFRLGSEEVFATLFREWYPAITYYALSMLKDSIEAEDVAESAFIKLWERRKQFISLPRCKSYLYSCVRNASIDLLRRRKITASGINELSYLTIRDKDNYFDQVLEAELAHRLHEAIETLPPACRKVVTMVYQEGKNNREIAKALNLSVNTVRNQKQRGISLLRKKLLFFFIILFPYFSSFI
jgi:RNA polymerase sigma-70 factor (family 1)